jgi:hypothetical protein
MRRRAILALIACLALAVPTAALAAKKRKTHKVNANVAAAVVGGQSGNTILAGTVSGTIKGAVVYNVKTAGNVLTVPFTAFTAKGALKGTGTATFTTNPDQSITYAGTGKIASGTGVYKGAKGTFTITGGVAANDTVIKLNLKGTVKY